MDHYRLSPTYAPTPTPMGIWICTTKDADPYNHRTKSPTVNKSREQMKSPTENEGFWEGERDGVSVSGIPKGGFQKNAFGTRFPSNQEARPEIPSQSAIKRPTNPTG